MKLITVFSQDGLRSEDELKDFCELSVKSFDFWSNDADDVYYEFYKKKRARLNDSLVKNLFK